MCTQLIQNFLVIFFQWRKLCVKFSQLLFFALFIAMTFLLAKTANFWIFLKMISRDEHLFAKQIYFIMFMTLNRLAEKASAILTGYQKNAQFH
jgi:hypothetical protein